VRSRLLQRLRNRELDAKVVFKASEKFKGLQAVDSQFIKNIVGLQFGAWNLNCAAARFRISSVVCSRFFISTPFYNLRALNRFCR